MKFLSVANASTHNLSRSGQSLSLFRSSGQGKVRGLAHGNVQERRLFFGLEKGHGLGLVHRRIVIKDRLELGKGGKVPVEGPTDGQAHVQDAVENGENSRLRQEVLYQARNRGSRDDAMTELLASQSLHVLHLSDIGVFLKAQLQKFPQFLHHGRDNHHPDDPLNGREFQRGKSSTNQTSYQLFNAAQAGFLVLIISLGHGRCLRSEFVDWQHDGSY